MPAYCKLYYYTQNPRKVNSFPGIFWQKFCFFPGFLLYIPPKKGKYGMIYFRISTRKARRESASLTSAGTPVTMVLSPFLGLPWGNWVSSP